jgi:DNA adenine methylase
MKTPISYYGGKQKLAPVIVPVITAQPHTLYCECFIGGGAVFFAKPESEVEVLNDTNRELINFYSVAKNRFVELEKMISVSLHSRWLHRDATVVYESPHLFDEVKRAWAVWVLSTQSFSSKLDGNWGFDIKKRTTTTKITNKRNDFTEAIAQRLQNVQLDCADALYVIKSRDSADSFFYCDPPYYNSDCGHYDGYSESDYMALLEVLSGIKGRFLLSSYPSTLLDGYIKQNGWHSQCFEQGVSVNAKGGYRKRKWEVLTANFKF